MRLRRPVLIFALIAGCSPAADPTQPAPMDAALPPGVTRLSSYTYSLDAGTEKYLCRRETLKADTWVREFIPHDEPGTHHQLLAVDPTNAEPDGESECGIFASLSWQVVFASGVGSPSLAMPPGVAFKLPAGTQLVHQVHAFNASGAPLRGTAAMDVKTMPQAEVHDEAELLLAGPLPGITSPIPVGDNQVVKGGCTATNATSFFAVFPHMHKLGRHIQVAARVGGVAKSVYDEAFRFEDQVFATFAPMPLAKGDRIEVACTYQNQTGGPVQFGESTNEEMCFAISYVFPKMAPRKTGSFCAK